MKHPPLEFVCEINVKVEKPFDIGKSGAGARKVIPILGGTFKGPLLEGTIPSFGADWQLIQDNGIAHLNARYILETNDDVTIYISNTGIRVASAEVLKKLATGEFVGEDDYYFRSVPVFETSSEKYSWLMKYIFIAKGIRFPDHVIIQVWKVL